MTDTKARIPDVSPLPLWDLAHAYCGARAFHVANELDIFSHLDEEKTSEDVAKLLEKAWIRQLKSKGAD